MKRTLSILLAVCLLVTALSACGTEPAADTAPSAEPSAAVSAEAATREFTDSTGRTVTVPNEVTRVAVSGPLTQIYAIPLVGDLMVGVSNYIAEDIEKYLPDYISTLPELGQLYGGGAEGYLGVLAPDSEGVALTRRLTRSQLKGFPAEPEFAAEAGLNPDSGPKQPPEPEKRTEREQDKGEPETAPPEGGALWYSAPDGTLSRFDGRRMLVALPSENVRVPDWAKGVVQRINGREYVVFPR